MTIINADCLDWMKSQPDNSIDCIVTDPPYGLKFMGKKWDHGLPPIEIWQEALRISKPGTWLLAFGGTRTYHRLTCNIEDAGWEIRDCIMWLHSQGFPKGKGQLKPAYEPIILARKKAPAPLLNIDGCRIGDEEIVTQLRDRSAWRGNNYGNGGYEKPTGVSEPRKGRWPANIILDEFYEQVLVLKNNIPNDIMTVIKEYFHDYKLPNLPKRNKDLSQPNKEEQSTILQQELLSSRTKDSDEGRETFHVWKDSYSRGNTKDKTNKTSEGEGESEVQRISYESRLQTSELRLASSVSIENSRENDKERINCRTQINDGTQIRKTSAELGSSPSYKWSQGRQQNGESGSNGQLNPQERTQGNSKGIESVEERERRLEVLACDTPEKWIKYFEKTDCEIKSPYCSAQMLDEQSGILKSGDLKPYKNKNRNSYSGSMPEIKSYKKIGDSGGASRFFYCAKASSSERAGSSHPTMKPIRLMEYLIKLVMPNDGILLDPFAGSGTTIVAAQNLGFNAIGIEKEKEYCDIAEARIMK